MNKIQFWVLNGLSAFFICLLVSTIYLERVARGSQEEVVKAQQFIQQGQTYDYRVRSLAARIYQVQQQSGDTGLHDLLIRQQITVAPPAAGDAAATPAPAPASAPAR